MRGYDRWLSTPPEVDEPVCPACGEYLDEDQEPVGSVVQEEFAPCDGQVVRVVGHSGESESDEALLAIIGEEYRGQEYVAEYAPCSEWAGEIVDHEPHVEVISVHESTQWHCASCGNEWEV